MTGSGEVEWSRSVDAAAWIAPRLAAFGSGTASSVVPQGFDSYVRIFHPAAARPELGFRTLRWSELAQWSRLPLQSDSQFHSVALPPTSPGLPTPLGQGPRHGTLDGGDLAALIEILGRYGSKNAGHYFCIWDGYGWGNRRRFVHGDGPGLSLPDRIPGDVRSGPRVSLPARDYLLYQGPLTAVSAFVESESQTPNLWWPSDHSWCVASAIDLSWTYVGGSRGLVSELLASASIECVACSPDSSLFKVEPWVQAWIDAGAHEVLTSGSTAIATPCGSVEVDLQKPRRWRNGVLTTRRIGPGLSAGSSQGPVRDSDESKVEDQVRFTLMRELLALVGT